MLHILVGPAATGKTTLFRLFPQAIRIKSVTTRPRRHGESDMDYEFVSDDRFDEMLRGRELACIREYTVAGHIWRYGMPSRELQLAIETDADRVCVLDPEGADYLCRRSPDRVHLYFLTETRARRMSRMRDRGDDMAHIHARVQKDAYDFNFYNHFHI